MSTPRWQKPYKRSRVTTADRGKEGSIRAFLDCFGAGTYEKIPKFLRKVMLQNALEMEACVTSGVLFPGLDRDGARKIEVPILFLSGEKSLPLFRKIEEELERLLPQKGRQRSSSETPTMAWSFSKPRRAVTR